MEDLSKLMRQIKTPLSIVVAVAKNNAIGKAGQMPWRIAEELRHFKKTTIYKPIIMGRKTFNSLNKPLVERANIVLTKKLNLILDENLPKNTSLHFCTDVQEGLKLADELALKMGAKEIMIIGGGSIYAQLLPYTSKIYLSRIDVEVTDADTFFPDLDKSRWQLCETENRPGFTMEIWKNLDLENLRNKLFTKSEDNLLDLTTKIEQRVDKFLHVAKKSALGLMQKMKLKKG